MLVEVHVGVRCSLRILFFTVVLAFVGVVDGQCNGASQIIATASGTIQSPNFGSENGRSANCSWIFNSISNENALVLTVARLKLYVVVVGSGAKICDGSYSLALNGRQLPCDDYVNAPTTASFCKSFYPDSTCSALSEVKSCGTKQLVTFPLEVKYEADGTIYGKSPEASQIWGFQINYEFLKCPKETTKSATTTSATATITSTVSPMTGKETFSTSTTSGRTTITTPTASPTTEKTSTSTSATSARTTSASLTTTKALFSTTHELVTSVTDTTSSEVPQPTIFVTYYPSTAKAERISTAKNAFSNSSPAVSPKSSPTNFTRNFTLSEAPPITDGEKPNGSSQSVIAGVSGGIGFLLIAVTAILIIHFRKRNIKQKINVGNVENEYVADPQMGSDEGNSNSSCEKENPSNDDEAFVQYCSINNVALETIDEENAYVTMQGAKASKPDETYTIVSHENKEESTYSELDCDPSVATIEPSPVDEEKDATEPVESKESSCSFYASIDTVANGRKVTVRYGKQTKTNALYSAPSISEADDEQ